MKRFLGFGLVLAIVLSYSVVQVLARGGHGGGHGGHHGGHHSGHHGHAGHHHHANNHHASHNAHHHAHWANHNRPFSRGWYGRHRGAWGGGWGWGNPWNIATWGTTAAWLGLGAATTPVWGGYGPTNTTIYDTDSEDLSAPGSEPPGGQNLSPEALAAESAAARELAAKGKNESGQSESFLPLGVFTLAPENQTEASAMLQLAVSKQGVLRGSYYDLLSDVDHRIRGQVDKKTQRVAWTFGPQGKVMFQTALGVLTEPSGPVSVHYENGQTRQWVLARYDKEPSEDDPQDDESGKEASADDAAKK
jgi:hypothetical protein